MLIHHGSIMRVDDQALQDITYKVKGKLSEHLTYHTRGIIFYFVNEVENRIDIFLISLCTKGTMKIVGTKNSYSENKVN